MLAGLLRLKLAVLILVGLLVAVVPKLFVLEILVLLAVDAGGWASSHGWRPKLVLSLIVAEIGVVMEGLIAEKGVLILEMVG